MAGENSPFVIKGKEVHKSYFRISCFSLGLIKASLVNKVLKKEVLLHQLVCSSGKTALYQGLPR